MILQKCDRPYCYDVLILSIIEFERGSGHDGG